MVICVPRLTVSAAGQIVLFWITIVAGLALGVQAPLGLVLPLGAAPLPPQAIAPATTAATQTLLNTRSIFSRPNLSTQHREPWNLKIPVCTSPGNRTARA